MEAVHLFLRVMVLPKIGGRILVDIDKTNESLARWEVLDVRQYRLEVGLSVPNRYIYFEVWVFTPGRSILLRRCRPDTDAQARHL